MSDKSIITQTEDTTGESVTITALCDEVGRLQDVIRRCDTLLEIAQHLASLSASTIRLHAGEMSAAEMRSVRAVLDWQARELMQRVTETLTGLADGT